MRFKMSEPVACASNGAPIGKIYAVCTDHGVGCYVVQTHSKDLQHWHGRDLERQ